MKSMKLGLRKSYEINFRQMLKPFNVSFRQRPFVRSNLFKIYLFYLEKFIGNPQLMLASLLKKDLCLVKNLKTF